ncbi:hypothetical protein AB0G05_27110 [Nonomuraea wenchangensis]
MLFSVASNFAEPPAVHQILLGVAAVAGATAAAWRADAPSKNERTIATFTRLAQ